ncbi:MAG TPA: RNA 2',3'-cyclic phosphodiesterase [Gemmatimonadales bacterium]|nr:RNA 2',3'-cyclic phosphodiesterase [Gemmatimonadales bacterium]
MRLFIALNFPEAVRRDLWQAIAPLRESRLPVKWVRPEGIHLTLKFLGDAAAETEPAIRAGLERAARGIRPQALTLEGLGAFPRIAAPRVIWVGITAEQGLELLQHHIEREIAPLGFPTEARAFHPHVTLARAERESRAREFAGMEAVVARVSFSQSVVVETVDLMQSTLQRGGAVYRVRHSERLA